MREYIATPTGEQLATDTDSIAPDFHNKPLA